MNLFLVPVGDDWMSRFEQTVSSPINTDTAPKELAELESIRLWGTTESESAKKKSAFRQMESGDLVLFASESEFFAAGRVGHKFQSKEIGKWAWDNPASSWVYTVMDYDKISIPQEDLWEILDYSENFHLQGFTRVSETALDSLHQQYNSIEEAYQDLKSERTDDGGEGKTDDEDDDDGGGENVRDHVEIQSKLIQLGLDHGYDVYVAKNDRNEEYDGQRLGDGCVENLSLTGFSDAAKSIIEYVDVIWLDGEHIVKMFEVESTTSIYSGILRMSDFVVKVPNLAVDMYIVAPDDDESQVRKQINRPTFQQALDPAEYCSLDYLSFTQVRNRYNLVQRAGPLQTVFP